MPFFLSQVCKQAKKHLYPLPFGVTYFLRFLTFVELDVADALLHRSNVPKWGALLCNVRQYTVSYPWTALYPALAFFAAILGFNLFGEGSDS